jgi:hypothetical protein
MLLLQISHIGSDDKEVIWGWLILTKRSSGDEEEDDQTPPMLRYSQQITTLTKTLFPRD